MTVKEIRQVRAQTLRQLAKELDVHVEELSQDKINVLLRAAHRARMTAFSDVASMCRRAADETEREGFDEPRRKVNSRRIP